MNYLTRALVTLVATVMPLQDLRSEGVLYDPVPPPGAAFVRLHHAGAGLLQDITIPGKDVHELAAHGTTPYFVMKQGTYPLVLGDARIELAVEAGRFYSLVHHAGETALHGDQSPSSRAKVLVALYNVDVGIKVSLRTADGRIPIVADVVAGSSASREMNAVRVALTVFAEDGRQGALGEVVLRRGSGYAVFVAADGESLDVRWVENRTNTRL